MLILCSSVLVFDQFIHNFLGLVTVKSSTYITHCNEICFNLLIFQSFLILTLNYFWPLISFVLFIIHVKMIFYLENNIPFLILQYKSTKNLILQLYLLVVNIPVNKLQKWYGVPLYLNYYFFRFHIYCIGKTFLFLFEFVCLLYTTSGEVVAYSDLIYVLSLFFKTISLENPIIFRFILTVFIKHSIL